jgi:hypothetical protein
MLSAIEEVPNSAPVPACLPPWRENPYGLVTLGTMLRFHASRFVSVMDTIAVISTWQLGKTAAQADIPSATYYEEILNRIRDLEEQLNTLQLRMAAKQARRIVDELESGTRLPDLTAAIDDLRLRVKDELETVYVFALTAEQADMYESTEPLFGRDIDDKFPSTADDIGEAGKCSALHRSTACVFHLMRVLEIALRAFADRFGVPSDRKNWHNIIEGIESKIREMPNDPNRAVDWKDQQEFFSGAATHFMFIKAAWRNYVAHGRDKSTEEEAREIFSNVREFMRTLATGLHE